VSPFLLVCIVGAAEAPGALDDANVVLQTPSKGAAGALPVGNGEVGASVWIEPGGDLLLYLARSDSFSEACRLLKVGKVRISFRPAPSTAFEGFREELKLRQGRLEIDLGALHLEVWVEPDRPVVRIAARAAQPFTAHVKYEGWRRERRVLNGTAELENSGWTVRGAPPSFPVVESADVVIAAEREPSALAWYHHNSGSVVPSSLRHQACEGLPGAFDPILHRTFGAWIEGPALRREGAEVLASVSPVTALDLRIACPSLVSPQIDRWLDRARALAHDAPDPAPSRKAVEAWWRDFWARSWIFVDQPLVRGSALPFRIGCDAGGGNRFSGDFGRIGVHARALRPAEIARLASGDPHAPAAVAAERILSADAPVAGQPLPGSARLEVRHGFTLEAWVRPADSRPARIFDQLAPGSEEGFALDTGDGRELRLIAGRASLSPPSLSVGARPSASHAFNELSALNDQVEIASSHDLSIPRFTWWDHRGTAEWVEYGFAEPLPVDGVEVYWFDDTAIGGACKVPASWRILQRGADGAWRPVEGAVDFPARPDAFNAVSFEPVRTTALRIEVRLRKDFSGGILEWRVREAGRKPLLVP
jgi:hypothetical protein